MGAKPIDGGAPRFGERGFALPTALWVAALVAALGAGALLLASIDARKSAAAQERRQAQLWAESVAELAAYRLAEAAPQYRQALADGAPLSLAFEGGGAEIRLSRESERLDLNRAEPAVIAAVLQEIGLPLDQAEAVAGAIADARDPDDLVRLNGAEDAAYKAAGLAHGPLNRPFRHPSEIALVLGVDPALAASLAERATVWGETPGGLFVDDLEDWSDRARGGAPGSSALAWAEALAGAEQAESFVSGGAIRIAVAARTLSGAQAHAELVAIVSPSSSPPYRVLHRSAD